MSTPSIVINGTSGAYEQPQSFGWDSMGPHCIRTWRGTAAAIATQYGICLTGGAQADIQKGLGTDTLTARYPLSVAGSNGTIDAPVDVWEFFSSHAEKDILEADLAVINGISDLNKQILRSLVQTPPSADGNGTYAPDPDGGGYFDDDGSRAAAESIYALMQSGVKAVRVMAPVMRHTQTVSNLYTVKAALTNVGKILSTTTLISFESIPTSVLFNLPTNTSTRTSPVLSYGWMKMYPTIRMAARMRMQIELEYEYGLWSNVLYGAPI